ncbi:hypothetical protein [Liquorilactobacillus uvarum]|uniref:Uncharacterized protein n=1 Tax=Liquorilactobacillus uvarum DSM 19971 TaxID=1423812 RepID=A0A0R1Q4Y7_9LACO|nr:hypothetical protein [Liquorilactobacillus uvarum]KRL37338.1 hypothetical protein FD20_GL000520 [Liquorilactobacillus uvarum DSM 19971]
MLHIKKIESYSLAEAIIGLLFISVAVIFFCENERYFAQNKKKAVAQYEATERLDNISKKILIDNEKKVLSKNEANHLQNKVSVKNRYGTLEVKIKNH